MCAYVCEHECVYSYVCMHARTCVCNCACVCVCMCVNCLKSVSFIYFVVRMANLSQFVKSF